MLKYSKVNVFTLLSSPTNSAEHLTSYLKGKVINGLEKNVADLCQSVNLEAMYMCVYVSP